MPFLLMTWYVYYSKIFVVDCIKMNFRRSFDLTELLWLWEMGLKGRMVKMTLKKQVDKCMVKFSVYPALYSHDVFIVKS